MNPKPTHEAFYNPGGRKFYFHHVAMAAPLEVLPEWTAARTDFNSTVNPLAPGAKFKFDVDFYNLTEKELSLLLYSIALEPDLRHKIGLAKPLGFGSVHITINRLELFDPAVRYSSQTAEDEAYEGEKLASYMKEKTSDFLGSTVTNIVDLRRIWKWDPENGTSYVYPTKAWFEKNSQVPISKSP